MQTSGILGCGGKACELVKHNNEHSNNQYGVTKEASRTGFIAQGRDTVEGQGRIVAEDREPKKAENQGERPATVSPFFFSHTVFSSTVMSKILWNIASVE